MGFFGLFNKKQSSGSNKSDIFLPEVPAVDDLDLPPPPVYPKARIAVQGVQQQIPIPPMIQNPIPEIKNITEKPFLIEKDKIEIPVEQLLRRNIEQTEIPRAEITHERMLNAMGLQKPIFVRVEDYREILDGATEIRNNLKEASDIVVRMNELKNEEDKEFEKWRLELEDIQRKLMYVDKVIFESS